MTWTPLGGMLPHLLTPSHDWGGRSEFCYRSVEAAPESQLWAHVMRAEAPDTVAALPAELCTSSTFLHVDAAAGLVYALVHCCYLHVHRFWRDHYTEDHADSISVWCCRVTASTGASARPGPRLQASLIECGAEPGRGTDRFIRKGEWTLVSAVRNATCACEHSICASRIDYRNYVRIGAFPDGRVYVTDGCRYIAQRRATADSAWAHSADHSFSAALGFPAASTADDRVLFP